MVDFRKLIEEEKRQRRFQEFFEDESQKARERKIKVENEQKHSRTDR